MPTTSGAVTFSREVLGLDHATEVERITKTLRGQVARGLQRRGVVVGVSGGVDSAVCVTLAARALGPERVLGLLMPEYDLTGSDMVRARRLCESLEIEHCVEDIGPALKALGCYVRRDEAIRRLVPKYAAGWRCKITVADALLARDRVNYFNLVVESPTGEQASHRMPLDVYLQVVAATNMKQRTRKLVEYYHAERRNYAVIGTPNWLEFELGFFVRGGDGLADAKPIAHLYKTQVYALAEHLGVPDEIRRQVPSTGTFSLPQTQEEFYFAVPYAQMDLLLYAFLHEVPASRAAEVLALTESQVERVYRDIMFKRRVAQRLKQAPLLVSDDAC